VTRRVIVVCVPAPDLGARELLQEDEAAIVTAREAD
jgi:hypothetical protein